MTNSTDLNQLNKRSVRGGAITLVSQVATVITQLASTVVLARMLTPDDYGVMGMVLSFVALAALFKDLGLSSAAIQKADLTIAQQSNLFWVNALFGLFLTLVFAASAPLVSWFYDRPDLLGMTLLLSMTFVLGGLSAQHNAMMIRHMHFGRQAIVNITAIAATFAVSVALASLDYGYWALGWGHVAGAAARTLLIWTFSPFVPGGWKRGVGTMDMIWFGANVTGFNFVNYFSRNLDNILIGKFVGADALGIYGRAYQLMLFPVQNLRGPIETVTYPALCRLQDSPEEWRQYHMQTLRVLAFLTMPLVAWMFLVAEPLILLLLGEAWAGVVPIFQILAIVAFIQPCASMVGSVMLSLGRSQRLLWQGASVAVVMCFAFAIGVNWGAIGVASAYAVAMYLVLVPMLMTAYYDTSMTLGDFFKSVSIPMFISLAALSAAEAARHFASVSNSVTEIMLVTGVYVFVGLGSLVMLPGRRKLMSDLRKIFRPK
ncbi:lipopolysaccharide biosynthesis protein [Thioclava pacifica]|uniref:Polysaccharide biosynthesis protein C-terminal domain-containing protein n=1 Tax=Thioclava pacifica DSM 10166 TaxID=1353537 RepID=A0A074JZE4_9RHOB|nr:lipopolysaccharide biosynthesis protein [Thioclava pacifica]KEO54697.1 hypothetical protein TP2_17330 [Thioclava pacifica DSM 10166]